MTGVLTQAGAVHTPPIVATVFAAGGNNAGAGAGSNFTFTGVTCSASGGRGPYTYNWSATSDGVGTWSISAGQGTPTVSLSVSGVIKSETSLTTVTCTVGDQTNHTAAGHLNFQYSHI